MCDDKNHASNGQIVKCMIGCIISGQILKCMIECIISGQILKCMIGCIISGQNFKMYDRMHHFCKPESDHYFPIAEDYRSEWNDKPDAIR